MMSWLTRNAADQASCTAPSRAISLCLLDLAEGVMRLSVVTIKLSMRSINLAFSGDDQDVI
jgi:hypothetical protein